MTAVLWGLLAAILVGTSDAIARKTSQHSSLSVLTLWVMTMSTAALALWLSITGQWPHWHLASWLASAVSGVLNVVVLYFLYLALRRGPVSVASPTSATFTVMLVGWNVLAGEPWAYNQLLAIGIVFLGIVMLTRRSSTPGIDDAYDTHWIRKTAAIALVAAFAVSVRMYLAQDANVELGAQGALFLNRLFALITAFIVVGFLTIKQTRLDWPTGNVLGLISLQAALEASALGVFLIGSSGAGRVGAAIGFSAFAAVTTLVASIWLGDRIGRARSIWISVVVVGLMLASVQTSS